MKHIDEGLVAIIWTFFAGATLVALQSVVSPAKRHWFALFVGMIFGGLGAVIGWGILAELNYGPWLSAFGCGMAAVASENILLGVFNLSKMFRDDPIGTIGKMWQYTPWGRKSDDAR